MSGRDCSFASQAPPQKLSASGVSPQAPSRSPSSNPSQSGVATPDAAPLTAPSLSKLDLSERSSINSQQDPSLDEPINLNHMELMIHLTLDKDMFNLSDGIGDFPSNFLFGIHKSLDSPYLLYQLLAFSARHLAFLHPESSASYHYQAAALQTRAVSLFNAAWTEVNQSNCVPILLFSTILGHHFLADTLAQRDPGGLEGFITHYIQCVEMHRGIYAIAQTAWPLLMESKLEQILSWSSAFNTRPPKGSHCQRIRELIDSSDTLSETDKEAFRQAIQYLQLGFDVVLAAKEEPGNRYQMIFKWTLLAPPEFTGLLAAKRPEVLVLLAYYALLLHHGRSMWQIGDAGVYILGLIVDYLGPGWDYWLEYPRQMIAKDVEQAL
ncbi:hypothetical protein BP6252_08966 [Coleophoma cylindrospora]|uniref:Uncharacterized protein n=1 Tax=Coleophoma cylindrospora TaxID=1849047 RepID=A0A3D8R0W3_9HELO|nr:hypothetical protein BP6252_08966 [Coleophoma cylindrospora]